MPSPLRTASCVECTSSFRTRSLIAQTCSPKCRAIMRERRTPSKGVPPKVYAPELVADVGDLYSTGMTIDAVAAKVGSTRKVVSRLMSRHGIPAQRAVPRNTGAERNVHWKGDEAGYQALHLRVSKARGKPSVCESCGKDDPQAKYEWSNRTGNYQDTADYWRLCVPCHQSFDAARRAETGMRTSLIGGTR